MRSQKCVGAGLDDLPCIRSLGKPPNKIKPPLLNDCEWDRTWIFGERCIYVPHEDASSTTKLPPLGPKLAAARGAGGDGALLLLDKQEWVLLLCGCG